MPILKIDDASAADPLTGTELIFADQGGTMKAATPAQIKTFVDAPVFESGTFTPTLIGTTTAGTNSYTTQNGVYRKIGDLVYIAAEIELDGTAGALDSTGPLRVSNLPFSNAAGSYHSFTVGFYTNASLGAGTGEENIVATMFSAPEIALYHADDVSTQFLADPDATDSFRIILSGNYIAA